MILTEEFLSGISMKYNINSYSETRILNENFYMAAENKTYDLFISHSFLDRTLIITLVKMFNELKYSVYVDWLEDKSLDRTNVTPDTAKLIRSRISKCKGLAYIATSNIVDSKWCPWELGIGDGIHDGRACILPVLENTADFKGTEFVGIYPYIDYAEIKNSENYDFWVTDQEDSSKYISLRAWLNGQEPQKHND